MPVQFSSRTGAEAKEYHYAKSATQGCKNRAQVNV
jgi:hypothetical protein